MGCIANHLQFNKVRNGCKFYFLEDNSQPHLSKCGFPRFQKRGYNLLTSAAVLVFLAAAAGAGVVAPDFRAGADGLALACASAAAAASLTTSLALPGEPAPPPNAFVF